MKVMLPALLCLVIAGCTAQTAEAPRVEPTPVITDTFCETAKKRSWSVKDTPATIAEARAWNRAVDKRCRP